jgi:hypothetical protein
MWGGFYSDSLPNNTSNSSARRSAGGVGYRWTAPPNTPLRNAYNTNRRAAESGNGQLAYYHDGKVTIGKATYNARTGQRTKDRKGRK